MRICTERLLKHYDLWIYHDSDCFVGSGTGVGAIKIFPSESTDESLNLASSDNITVALSWDLSMVGPLA